MTSVSGTDLSQLGISEPRYSKDTDEVPEQTVVRERFVSGWNSLFCFIGFITGPGNVWRFPYLVLKHGGAIFVLVYLLALITIAMPLAFLELGLGQYSGKDMVNVWDVNPAFRGLGFSMLLVSWMGAIIFHTFMAHCIIYSYEGIRHNTPWYNCRKAWKNCVDSTEEPANLTRCDKTSTYCFCTEAQYCEYPNAASNYYRYEVLGTTPGDHSFGLPSVSLTIILLFSWTLVVMLTFRGIKTTCKLIYASVTVPCIGFIAMLLIICTREGSEQGFIYLFGKFQWDRLLQADLWADSVGQALFTLSACTGTVIMLGSYRHFDTQTQKDIVIVTAVDTLTSLLISTIVFEALFNATYRITETYEVDKLAIADLGLVFTVFPQAIRESSFAHVWSVVVFSLIYMFVIDNECGFVESVMSYLQDDFRIVRRRTSTFRIMFAAITFGINVLLTCPGGYHVLLKIDAYGIGVSIPVIAFLECIAISWGYGFWKWLEDMEYMLGFKLPLHYLLLSVYSYYIPLFLAIVIIASTMSAESVCPLGVCLAILVLAPIPVWFGFHLYAVCRRKHSKALTFRRFMTKLMKPSRRWTPNDGSNIKRHVDTVFADVFRKLRTHRCKTMHKQYSEALNEFEKEVDNFYGVTRSHAAGSLGNEGPFSKKQGVKFITSASNVSSLAVTGVKSLETSMHLVTEGASKQGRPVIGKGNE